LTDIRRALFAGLWDYAGVFPPAELPLEQALVEWHRIRESEDAWLVNRLVVRIEHVELCGSEPLAVVDGSRETQGDVVYVEGETKLRCGGARVPSVDEVAAFIRRGVPFKATAGLHHALPTEGEHGFLNLLAACLWPDDAEELLSTRDITVDADIFCAAGHGAAAQHCTDMRSGALRSIGSCSFREARDELRALGIL
jgi:hypothetical protein